jgi:hypothetical protein
VDFDGGGGGEVAVAVLAFKDFQKRVALAFFDVAKISNASQRSQEYLNFAIL